MTDDKVTLVHVHNNYCVGMLSMGTIEEVTNPVLVNALDVNQMSQTAVNSTTFDSLS